MTTKKKQIECDKCGIKFPKGTNAICKNCVEIREKEEKLSLNNKLQREIARLISEHHLNIEVLKNMLEIIENVVDRNSLAIIKLKYPKFKKKEIEEQGRKEWERDINKPQLKLHKEWDKKRKENKKRLNEVWGLKRKMEGGKKLRT